MTLQPIAVLAGVGFAAAIALAAWRARSLSIQGAAAAFLLGTVIFGLGGLGWAFLLLGFFISSSVLSRMFRKRKAAFDEKFSKGTVRDAGQVAANGGIAGLFVLLHVLLPGAGWPWVGFAAALAAANADTWATELGVLSQSTPRLITTGKTVESGTSGGVSGLGLLAAAGGSLLIALLAVVFWQGTVIRLPAGSPEWLAWSMGSNAERLPLAESISWLFWITLAGFAGSLFDSLLGATIQAIYVCPACQKETERHPLHSCGTPTRLERGWSWMNNDWVNTLCTLAGAVVAVLAMLLTGYQ
jgi:uncharacterized protein (TIGR00297 family)